MFYRLTCINQKYFRCSCFDSSGWLLFLVSLSFAPTSKLTVMKRVLVFSFTILIINSINAQVKVQNLLVENLSNPIGMDITSPRLSWQLVSNTRNVMQTAYEVRVGTTANPSKEKNLQWSSGKINSDSSVQVAYKGMPLQSGKKYFWQVRVWDNEGRASSWSETSSWQMGLLDSNEWKAKWIESSLDKDGEHRPAIHFRKEFQSSKKVQSATAYITAHGLYEAMINGKRVGDFYLTPGWTSYNKRLQYQTYDVTDLLRQGSNAVGATLGNGWYRGYLAWDGNKNTWGNDLSLLFQLDITYSDGSKGSVVSDGSWKSSTGSILDAEIYNGEIIDVQKEKTGWSNIGYNDGDWVPVTEKNYSKSVLVATQNEPIRKHETFSPVKVFTTPKGERVIDFGQNLVGWVMVKLNGKAGDTVKIYHAEVLDKDGNFYTDNLRAAKAQAVYILKGGEENFEPHFTFFGFRYIKIEGLSEIKPENFTAVALYSNMQPTGTFACSNPLINQLQHNIQWGQKGNFLDVPTDCPQRDERLGWTGDAQAFSRTAAFNMNVNNFFAKWLKDVAADQYESGSVPFVIPNVLGPNSGGSTGWADVCTIIPWNMYLAYGDKRILEQQYPSMKAWVDYMTKSSKNDLWNTGFHFGDWLFYRPFDDNDGRSAVTDKYLIAQSFWAYSTQLLINTANVLGKTNDANTYSDLLKRIKDAYLKEYVTPNGRLISSTQTAYVLALNFDMLPESLRPLAAQRLVDNIKDYGVQLTTGFLGTPYLCHVLTRFGYDDIAYKLLLRDKYPSWLYPVKMGATTIWERWDGTKPDGSFQTPGMNSFNHYAYGAIGDWMYRTVAGINLDENAPGYKKIIIKPHLTDSLSFASASLQTYYGKVSSEWKKENGKLVLNVEVPPNTTATVFIPSSNADDILESGKKINEMKEISVTDKIDNYVSVKLGSGKYFFTVKD
jgi:alpha-L-rhamnosidase